MEAENFLGLTGRRNKDRTKGSEEDRERGEDDVSRELFRGGRAMLTGQQSCLLRFIESRLAEGDVSPSFEEMRLHLGLRSKSGVHRLVEGLRERGCVVRLPHRARSLRVVRRSEGSGEGRDEVVRLPFLGNVAAGLPIEAVGVVGWDEEREYPSELLGRRRYGREVSKRDGNRNDDRNDGNRNDDGEDDGENGKNHESDVRRGIRRGIRGDVGRDVRGGVSEGVNMASHYALRVEGDSMVGAGILDGDTVIVEACDDACDGELVIALVDGGDATLKILRRRDGEVVLEAANEAYEAQRYEAGRVRVQGRVTGLMRRYARR